MKYGKIFRNTYFFSQNTIFSRQFAKAVNIGVNTSGRHDFFETLQSGVEKVGPSFSFGKNFQGVR